MQIVVGNIPEDSTEDSLREALESFTLTESITINRDGSVTTALIDVVMTRDQAQALAKRIQGRMYKGRALTAWVPAMGWE
jgi:RNA recognition motif-containing protein